MSYFSKIGHLLKIRVSNDEQLAKFLEEIHSLKKDGLNVIVTINPDDNDRINSEHKFTSLKLELMGVISQVDEAVSHLRKSWVFSQSSEFIQVRIEIPASQHQDPVISHLVSDFGVTVNINTAFLGANGIGGGWFDLRIDGERDGLEQVMSHLTHQHLLIA
jgi:NIL domain